MNLLFLGAGIALLGFTVSDFAYTTIGANKSGPLTHRTAAGFWRLVGAVADLTGLSKVLRLAGPVVMSGVAFVWISLTSLGWLLIYRSDPQSLTMQSSGETAGWWDALAFVVSALSTAGASNARPASALWDNLSMVMAVNGMVVLTLSVTYVLNITQSVASGRGFSALTSVRDPADERNDSVLLPALSDLCVRLNAAPLALYYSSRRVERSLPESLYWLARRVAASPERFDQYRTILVELPYFEADPQDGPEAFLNEMERWVRRYSHGGR